MNVTEMMDDAALQLGATPMRIKSDDVTGAETDGSTMFYDPGFMSQVQSAAGEDGVRFIVAHELGHQVGGMYVGGHAGEFMADDYAARALARMGASFSAIESVFSFLNANESKSHPSSSARLSNARKAYMDEPRLIEMNDTPKPVSRETADLAI